MLTLKVTVVWRGRWGGGRNHLVARRKSIVEMCSSTSRKTVPGILMPAMSLVKLMDRAMLMTDTVAEFHVQREISGRFVVASVGGEFANTLDHAHPGCGMQSRNAFDCGSTYSPMSPMTPAPIVSVRLCNAIGTYSARRRQGGRLSTTPYSGHIVPSSAHLAAARARHFRVGSVLEPVATQSLVFPCRSCRVLDAAAECHLQRSFGAALAVLRFTSAFSATPRKSLGRCEVFAFGVSFNQLPHRPLYCPCRSRQVVDAVEGCRLQRAGRSSCCRSRWNEVVNTSFVALLICENQRGMCPQPSLGRQIDCVSAHTDFLGGTREETSRQCAGR